MANVLCDDRSWWRGLLGAILPETCPLCTRPSPPDQRGSTCAVCTSRLPQVARYCRRCSAPVGPHLETSGGCGYCRRDRFAFTAAFTADEYKDLMRTAVLAAKRADGGPTAVWLADRLWECRGEELARLNVDLVVPVPRHWTRRLVAPHNVAELMARRLAGRLNARFSRHIVAKVRRTPKQAKLSPSARRANLRNAFQALRTLHGRRLLLVDDVLTTGTTADRVSRALRQAGAEAVWVAAAARGIGA